MPLREVELAFGVTCAHLPGGEPCMAGHRVGDSEEMTHVRRWLMTGWLVDWVRNMLGICTSLLYSEFRMQ
jgi:hypothetical protein